MHLPVTLRFMRAAKFKIGNRVKGNDKKASFWDRTGVVVQWLSAKSEYGVRFDDRPDVVEYTMSSWLDPAPLNPQQSSLSVHDMPTRLTGNVEV